MSRNPMAGSLRHYRHKVRPGKRAEPMTLEEWGVEGNELICDIWRTWFAEQEPGA